MNHRITTEQRLREVLEAWGADPDHWPDIERQDLLALIERSASARQLLDEAAALDQLLDLAVPQEAAPDMSALEQRIMGDFAAEKNGGRVNDTPVLQDLAAARRKKRLKNPPIANGFQDWMTPLAFAACFALGLYLGVVGIGDWRLDPGSTLASLAGNGEQLAELGDYVAGGPLEEDLL